jgi:hypothetical protein
MVNNIGIKTKTALLFLILASLLSVSGFSRANTTMIVSKIVNMEVPENLDFSQAFEESTFIIYVDYQIENPTNDSVLIGCSTAPIFRLKIDALFTEEELNITSLQPENPTIYFITLEPGILSVNTSFRFMLKPYYKTYLPKGNYTFWIDFHESCSGNFSLVPLKSFMNITEEEIFISHEADGKIQTFDRITVIDTNFYMISIILSIPILSIFLKRRKRKNSFKHV